MLGNRKKKSSIFLKTPCMINREKCKSFKERLNRYLLPIQYSNKILNMKLIKRTKILKKLDKSLTQLTTFSTFAASNKKKEIEILKNKTKK